VDTETERQIQEAMDRLVAGRTVFAIAHRLSTLVRASRLFVMKDGRLAECGTHAELLEREGGIYRRLYELQREIAKAI
jgi:ATP-binding cassette subfamily B protein